MSEPQSRPAETADDDWSAALAGRPRKGASPEVLLEAQLMRAALLRRAPGVAAAAAGDEAAVAAGEQRLQSAMAGIERGGDSATRGCVGCARRRGRLRAWVASLVSGSGARWPALSAAAGLAAVAALLLRVPAPPEAAPEAPVLRGHAVDVHLVSVADPSAARNALAERLAAGGARVQRYERLGRFGLDASWPDGRVPEEAARMLAEAGLGLPADGVVKVEFAAGN